jgi:hypothetical protein
MPPPYSTIPVPVVTPLPETTFGHAFDVITNNSFDIVALPRYAMDAYVWPVMNSLTIPTFLVLFFIYLGLWLAQGNVRVASIVGLLFGGALMFSAGGMGMSIPVDMIAISYGALVASIAGLVMSMFKST